MAFADKNLLTQVILVYVNLARYSVDFGMVMIWCSVVEMSAGQTMTVQTVC